MTKPKQPPPRRRDKVGLQLGRNSGREGAVTIKKHSSNKPSNGAVRQAPITGKEGVTVGVVQALAIGDYRQREIHGTKDIAQLLHHTRKYHMANCSLTAYGTCVLW